MIHRRLPFPRGAAPVRGDVAQGEPQQFGRRLVGREVAPGLDDLAQPHVHRLDGVGGVDDPPHLRREGKERGLSEILCVRRVGLTPRWA